MPPDGADAELLETSGRPIVHIGAERPQTRRHACDHDDAPEHPRGDEVAHVLRGSRGQFRLEAVGLDRAEEQGVDEQEHQRRQEGEEDSRPVAAVYPKIPLHQGEDDSHLPFLSLMRFRNTSSLDPWITWKSSTASPRLMRMSSPAAESGIAA